MEKLAALVNFLEVTEGTASLLRQVLSDPRKHLEAIQYLKLTDQQQNKL